MKFSVLLPTRNRLNLLTYAIETVRRQDYANWEIIVSDNFSEEDIEGYVRSLNDPRIKYFRTNSFVPVTDNWNNALEHSDGDYVVMLGDDDCLMKGYFSTLKKLIENFNGPDFVYTNAFLYAYPGVLPDSPNGFLRPYAFAPFFKHAKEPFLLETSEARYLARQAMSFKMIYTYNMQHSLIRRSFINLLSSKGKFFQSPYPDYYATNVMMLEAKTILICPFPVVTVGISPKSFGYYFFNSKESDGYGFLNNLSIPKNMEYLLDIILPGAQDRTSWLLSMEYIKNNYGSSTQIKVNYSRYRYLQILYVYAEYFRIGVRGFTNRSKVMALKKMMRWWEKLLYIPAIWVGAIITMSLPRTIRVNFVRKVIRIITKSPKLYADKDNDQFKNILEVFEQVNPLSHYDLKKS